MVVSVSKPDNEIIEMVSSFKKLFIVSCGIGVQATGNILDIPAIPANDTLSSQGMQRLWPSPERCAGCGTCYLALTGEIGPPKGIDLKHCMEEEVSFIKDRVIAINVTDNQSSVMRISSQSVCSLPGLILLKCIS